jgi:Prealbumin-like fold domain
MLFRSLIGFLVFAGFCFGQTSPTPMTTNESGIEGVVVVSPAHGGAIRVGEQSSKPLANVPFVVANDKGTIAEFTTDEQGRFKITLAPGHYTVARKGAQKGIGRFGPFDVDVSAGQMTKVEWRCDSGMR